MRKSRLLLAGVAVAAAAVGTSAFTASNTVPNSVAGSGQGSVTGAVVTDIHYVQNAADATVVDAVEFTSTTNLTGKTTTMTLKTTGGTVVVGTPYTCAVKTAWDALAVPPIIVMTCDTTGSPRTFDEFDSVAITVVQ
ncbi:hypothetical protein [Blastococcus sp. CT_GayMR16]|uniref:hypothetical protein n=1 Tax=Blastococcus sp. CT_GayMR16 TaxID=2559607 RepID=UPI0010731FBD|nr:hypothetical protein [Blastococcus sp. CT_GayMR16]TFV86251.1 hypothetical protein E4P38_17235 [Blastococcus sp. CT_GayMR16]